MNAPVVHSRAYREWAKEVKYYLKNAGSGVAVNFDAAVDATIREAATSPYHFPRWRRTYVRQAIVPDFPYVVYFVDHPQHIQVFAVAHTSRRPGYWKSRMTV